MDRKEFKEKLKKIGINQKKFAAISGQGYSTVKNWDSVPKWVEVILNYMEVFNSLNNIDTSLYKLDNLRDKIKVLERYNS